MSQILSEQSLSNSILASGKWALRGSRTFKASYEYSRLGVLSQEFAVTFTGNL